nr:MAG TPA: hypothetical protein [Caudoviricetes sp.]
MCYFPPCISLQCPFFHWAPHFLELLQKLPTSSNAIHAAVPTAQVNVQCINVQMAHTAAHVTPQEMPSSTARIATIINASATLCHLLSNELSGCGFVQLVPGCVRLLWLRLVRELHIIRTIKCLLQVFHDDAKIIGHSLPHIRLELVIGVLCVELVPLLELLVLLDQRLDVVFKFHARFTSSSSNSLLRSAKNMLHISACAGSAGRMIKLLPQTLLYMSMSAFRAAFVL